MKLLSRPPGIAALVLVVIVGLAIGGWLAIASRQRDQRTTTVARNDAVPAPQPPTRTPASRPTVAPTAPPATAAPTVAATAAPTIPATATPASTPTAVPTTAATTAPPVSAATAPPVTAAHADASAQGAWEIDEANVQVGTIVWSGRAVASSPNAIALAVRKASIGGRAASPCERDTVLRATLATGVSAQTVPYQEVNCQGESSAGEVRVTSFASDGRAFHGSFWLGGVKLGDFDARRRP